MTGAEIKQAREARGWSLEQLAKASAITVPILKDIEKGSPDAWNALPSIRKALGLLDDADDLLSKMFDDGGKPRPPPSVDAEREDFDWNGDEIVIHEQPKTAIYRNVNYAVVIRQQGTNPHLDDDQFVFFATTENVRALILALRKEIGDA